MSVEMEFCELKNSAMMGIDIEQMGVLVVAV